MSTIYLIINSLVLIGLIITALAVVRFKDLISAAISLGSSSLLLSLEFYLLRAPDVAIAEAAVGAALTTAIYVFAIKSTEREEGYK